MKKTFTVNIRGIVFHIDEDAYEVLNDYLQSIKQYFAKTEGGDEIISDIETRIAEMLRESIGDEKQVITLDDIEKVIEVIGQPSEFGGEPEDETAWQQKSEKSKTIKRLYRDPDRSILGGVCGGLGAYFHTDPVWFRLAFVIFSLPGFGTPLIIYFILWIVIPEARTAAEKLQMKGEKVNISNIEKSIREEIGNMKNKFNDFTKGAKQTYKKKSAAHRSDFRNVGNALAKVLELFVKVILIFTGIILLIVGISLIAAFLITIFGWGGQIFILDSELIYVSLSALSDLIFGNTGSNVFFKTGLILFISIPLFLLLLAGVKLIFGIEKIKYIGITALNLWLIGLILTVFYGFKIAKSFSHHGIYKESVSVEMPYNSPLYIDVKNDEDFKRIYRYEDYFEIDDMNMIITTDENDPFYGIPQLEIEKSSNDQIELEIYYRSKGKNRRVASERANNTIYNYSVNDTLMVFDPFFKIADNEVWRKQQVDLVLKVPEGCYLQLSENMYKILDNHHHSPSRLSGETWQMTKTGLKKSEFVPSEREDKIETEKEYDFVPDEESENNPVSMIGFLYTGFLEIFGFRI